MATTPAEPAPKPKAVKTGAAKAKARTGKGKPARRSSFERAIGVPAKPTQAQAIAEYAEKGAETYADRRLLDIAESVAKIQFWVTLWSGLAVIVGGFALLLFIVATINNS